MVQNFENYLNWQFCVINLLILFNLNSLHWRYDLGENIYTSHPYYNFQSIFRSLIYSFPPFFKFFLSTSIIFFNFKIIFFLRWLFYQINFSSLIFELLLLTMPRGQKKPTKNSDKTDICETSQNSTSWSITNIFSQMLTYDGKQSYSNAYVYT